MSIFFSIRKLLALSCLLLLAACAPSTPSTYQGYAEGEWLYLASPQGGYLETLNLARGDHAERGHQAFTLGGDQGTPRHRDDPAALEAQLRAAEAALQLATAQLKRQQELARQNFASPSRTDELLTAQVQAAAQVRVLREQLANKTGFIPADGLITEVYYHRGEWVPPGQPVLSLLPDERRLIRFYVPEKLIATLHAGQAIEARCDGCGAPISARITFVAATAEYTPPVIYSQGAREKMVFRVEALPNAQDTPRLPPGLPLDVSLK